VSQNLGVAHSSSGPALAITVGESGPFFSTKSSYVYGIKRTYRLKVENTDLTRTVHGCKLHLLSIEPKTDYHGPWLLEEGFSLAAGDHKFIPFVRYGEASDLKAYNCADSFMEILPATVGQPTLGKEEKHCLRMRVTGVDAAPVDLECYVWVDEEGRLRVGEAWAGNWMSLSARLGT
jgi:hypothetical protein